MLIRILIVYAVITLTIGSIFGNWTVAALAGLACLALIPVVASKGFKKTVNEVADEVYEEQIEREFGIRL